MAAQTDEALLFETLRRSQPSVTRPRMKTEVETKLATVEVRSAQSYAEIEVLTNKCDQLAESLSSGTVVDPEADKHEPEEWDDDPSLVRHVEELRETTKSVSQEIAILRDVDTLKS